MPTDLTESLPLLTFDSMRPGRRFRTLDFTVTPERVERYREATDDAVDYEGCVPPAFGAILARLAYLQDHRMPPGGVLLRQSVQWLAPALVGRPISATAEVTGRDEKKGRKLVMIACTASQGGRSVAVMTLEALWPA